MCKKVVAVSSIYILIIFLALICTPELNAAPQSNQADHGSKAKSDESPGDAPVELSFKEFFDPADRELKPSARLLSLKGKRVRLVGFMAKLENPPKGAFYLCPRPIQNDESGGGTGDLPVEHVRVIMRSAKDRVVPHIAHLIEVTGILEIGNREEEDGTVSAIRLLLDGPRTLSGSPEGSPEKQRR